MSRVPTVLVLSALLLAGCSSMYYAAMESIGVPKREILADRVEAGRNEQEAAKEQFVSALDAFKNATDFYGGELDDVYSALQKEYDRCEQRATAVHKRIANIEDVAVALFEEWKAEIDLISSPDLSRSSEDLLKDTQRRYDGLVETMKRAEASMQPVLTGFYDQVLFLKHNLNAQAIASLQANVANIEDEIAILIRDMEAAIAEADAFIATLG